MRIPFGPFEPDKSEFNTAVSGNIINALPVSNGWGPMASLNAISDALGSECRGAVYARAVDGTTVIIAATAAAIYRLDTTDYSWDDISGSSAPYSLGINDSWTFTLFGSKLVIHNLADPIQVFDIESGTVCADLAGSPPKAKYSWVAGDFLVLGYTDDTAGERSVRWSGANDIEYWTIGAKGADFQVLPEGGIVVGGCAAPSGFYVLSRSAMNFFSFSPASGYTFTRELINPKQGCVAPRSIVSTGPGVFFYLSEDGFFSGAQRQPIGAERVDRWFFDAVSSGSISDVQGFADPFEKIIWWRFTRGDATSYMLGYDWQLDRWCTSDTAATELVALAVPDVTWDGLDALFASISEVDVPFDSRLFLNGRPTMAAFTSDNKLAFFSGVSLASTFTTNLIQADDKPRVFCGSARVYTDATGYSLTDTVYDYHGAAGATSPASMANRAGLVPLRSDGRLHQFTLTIPEGSIWSIVSDIDANMVASGEQ